MNHKFSIGWLARPAYRRPPRAAVLKDPRADPLGGDLSLVELSWNPPPAEHDAPADLDTLDPRRGLGSRYREGLAD